MVIKCWPMLGKHVEQLKSNIIKGGFFILNELSQPFKELQNLGSLTDIGAVHRLRAVSGPPCLVLLSAELWFC